MESILIGLGTNFEIYLSKQPKLLSRSLRNYADGHAESVLGVSQVYSYPRRACDAI